MFRKTRTTTLRLVSLLLPLAGSHALIGALEVTDAAMMRDLGGHSFVAGSFAVSVVVTARITCTAMFSVVGPLVAAARVRGAWPEVLALSTTVARTTLLVGLGAELLLSLSLGWWSPASLPHEVTQQSIRFARILGLGLPCALLFSAARQVLSGLGHPLRLLPLMLLAVPLNAGLNLLLSRGLGPLRGAGLEGIAWSTVTIELFLAVLAWTSLRHQLKSRGVDPAVEDQTRPETVGSLLRRGAPLSLAAGLEVGVFQLSGLVVSQAGTDSLGAHQALLTVAGYASALPVALMSASSLLAAEEHAARGSVQETYRGVIVVAVGLGLGLGVSVWLTRETLMSLFVARSSEAWRIATRLAPGLALLLFVDMLQSSLGGLLRGLQDTLFVGRIALLSLGLGGAGGLGLALLFGGSVVVVWALLTSTLVVLAIAYGVRLRRPG